MPKSFSFEEKVFVLSESEKTTHIKDVGYVANKYQTSGNHKSNFL